jgi:hypothetical protein
MASGDTQLRYPRWLLAAPDVSPEAPGACSSYPVTDLMELIQNHLDFNRVDPMEETDDPWYRFKIEVEADPGGGRYRVSFQPPAGRMAERGVNGPPPRVLNLRAEVTVSASTESEGGFQAFLSRSPDLENPRISRGDYEKKAIEKVLADISSSPNQVSPG